VAEIEISHCRECRHFTPNPDAQFGYQRFRCGRLNFYVGDVVLKCAEFRRGARNETYLQRMEDRDGDL
jgi:hypothetical protein